MEETFAFTPIDVKTRKALDFNSGDNIRVWSKIQDKGKYRLQAFEGIVLARKHGDEAGATFTVRKVASGVGVEKIFPLYSPIIDKIEIVKRSKVRRAKLYHIREKAAKEIKRQMRNTMFVDMQTVSDTEEANEKVAKAEAEKKEEAKKAQEAEVVEEVSKESEDKDLLTEASAEEGEKIEEAKSEEPKEEEKQEDKKE